MNPFLSVIVPAYNESQSIEPLYRQLKAVLEDLGTSYEIIFIDDGSQDKTPDLLRELAALDDSVKVLIFRRNFGQTAAMSAGFEFAAGEVIVAMDADLQNDPQDIPELLGRIKEGYDVVSGWRQNRQDDFVSKKIPSLFANKLISWVSGVPLKDYGCTLKAYRREFVKNMRLYGEMHRFIPIYAHWGGARITEIPVKHHPRVFGKSKYGLIRTFKVLLDLITVKFFGDFSTKPIYVFGGLGLSSVFLGAFIAAWTLFEKLCFGLWVHRNPLFSIAIFFLLIGFQFILMGLLAEIMVRVYHESAHTNTYWIRDKINFKKIPAASNS